MKIYSARASLCHTDGPEISLRKYEWYQRCLLFPGELASSKVVSGAGNCNSIFRRRDRTPVFYFVGGFGDDIGRDDQLKTYQPTGRFEFERRSN